MKQTFSIKESQIKEAELTIGDFFLTLLHSATNTHILHLQSRSYSEHQALGAFYDEIVELTDNLIEAWQGKNRQLATYPNTYYPPMDSALLELQDLSYFVQSNRLIVGLDTELQNITDEIQQLIDSTIYKLTFLK